MHGPLDRLDAIDMTFDDARAPRQGESGDDGAEVKAQALREGQDGRRRVSFSFAYPRQHLVAAPLLET